MMMRILLTTLLITNVLLPDLLPASDPSGPEIVQRVNDLFNPETSVSRARMTITTSSGGERTFEFMTWSRDRGEKKLVRYLSPARVKDQATLMLNQANDIWMFFPRTRRVRKLATHSRKQKMQGSDFSYEDMGAGDAFVTDYAARRLKDTRRMDRDCFAVELVRRPHADMTYSRMILHVDRANFVPLEIEYFSENDPQRRIKHLERGDIREVDGIPTPFRSIMFNENDGTSTRMDLLEIEFNRELPPAMFTERELKK